MLNFGRNWAFVAGNPELGLRPPNVILIYWDVKQYWVYSDQLSIPS